jgi:hypothetical protein
MATSLGEAYSILGSAQGAEFKRRREEERKPVKMLGAINTLVI